MLVAAPRVAVVPIGPTRCAAVPWRLRGQLRVSAIVKATFAFVPGGPMRLVDPEAIDEAEVHYQNHPARSIQAASELSPHLARADILLTGHACAPARAPATRVATRLALHGRMGLLLDKTLHVVGDHDEAGTTPFQRMPIVYERAYGGIGNRENPVGVGAGGDTMHPNILDPGGPNRLAGFGPISKTWPLRRSLISAEQRALLSQPIPEIKGDFDWSYFQAAPPDQRVEHLLGDEWLLLAGLHPEHAQLTTRLPFVQAMARFYQGGQTGTEGLLVPLNADTLRIDADAERCSITWRGGVEVADVKALASLWIAAGVSRQGAPIDWPASPPRAQAPPREAPRPPVQLSTETIRIGDEDTGEPDDQTIRIDAVPSPIHVPLADANDTMQLDPTAEDAARARQPLPFSPRHGLAQTQPLVEAPRAEALKEDPVAALATKTIELGDDEIMTLAIDAPEQEARRPEVLPFAPPPRVAGTQPLSDAVIDQALGRDPLPFARAKAPAGEGPRPTAARAIPGAPWAGGPAEAPPRPRPFDFNQTIDLERVPSLLSEIEPPRAPPPVKAPPPAITPVIAPAIEAKAETPAPAPKVSPPPPKPPPKPVAKGSLYKKFVKR